MEWVDASYVGAMSVVAGIARAVDRALPPAWQLRLRAEAPRNVKPGWIWVHAVSVGELILAQGILRFLLGQGHRVHVSTGTPAGLSLLNSRLFTWDPSGRLLSGGAFPVDDPRGLAPFFETPPGLFLALETEIWPNLLRTLESKGIPSVIVNGRLTARSLDRGGAWIRRAAQRLSFVAARDEESRQHFERLGAPRVALGGNLKADLPEPNPLHEGWAALRQAWADAPIWVAGNTVEGEEELILEAWREARAHHSALRLILAPRQPRRFGDVAERLARQGLRIHRASTPWPTLEAFRQTEILLLDTLGELSAAYGEGSLALVGGGWLWHGGHNPLEAVRFGMPTLAGPGFENFKDVVDPLREAALLEIVDKDALKVRLNGLMDTLPLRPAAKKIDLPPSLKGTLERSCFLIKEFLPAP